MIKGVASLVNEDALDVSSSVVFCETGLSFLQEASRFHLKPFSKTDIDGLNEKFYKFVKQSLQLYSLARSQSVFIDLVCMILKNSKLPKSFTSILKGFRSQAYSDADLQENRVVPAV